MEPMDDPKLRNVLREWKVEDAPSSLDKRVLGARRPWWKALLGGSVRVPVPVLAALAVLVAAMGAALMRARAVPATPAASSAINLADFRPVEDVQVRIMRGNHEAR
jgi:hypothetical protein